MQAQENAAISGKWIIAGAAGLILLVTMAYGLVTATAMRAWQTDYIARQEATIARYARNMSAGLAQPFNILEGLASDPDFVLSATTPSLLQATLYQHPNIARIEWVSDDYQLVWGKVRLDDGLIEGVAQTNVSLATHRRIVRLSPDTVFISRVGLNRLAGELITPPEPSLRFALRLTGGYVVLSIDPRQLLDEDIRSRDSGVFLADVFASWLRHENLSWQARHELGHDIGVDTTHPKLWRQLRQRPQGSAKIDGQYWVWAKTNAESFGLQRVSLISNGFSFVLLPVSTQAWWTELVEQLRQRLPLWLLSCLVIVVFGYWLNRYQIARLHWESLLVAKQQALAQRTERAEQISQAKDLFIANLSHEIRTPLNAIVGFISILQRSQLNPSQRSQLQQVEQATEALLIIVNDILDFSKLEFEQVELALESQDLSKSVAQSCGLYRPLAIQKGLSLRVWFDPAIEHQLRFDSERLMQVLNNLLSNAIKFTKQGQVALTVRCLEQSSDFARLQFEVSDTGKGIHPESFKKIFEHFTQEDDLITREYGGTGLGLAICQSLIYLMGGKQIEVTSTLGEGSCFQFELCFDKAEPLLAEGAQTIAVAVHSGLADDPVVSYLAHWQWLAEDGDVQVILASDAVNEVASLSTRQIIIDDSHDASLTQALAEVDYALLVPPVMPMALRQAIVNAPSAASELPDERTFKHAKVVLVDDTPTNLLVGEAMLKLLDVTPTLLDSGQALLDWLANHSVDLVLLDVHMPNMSGLDVVRTLRQDPAFSGLPVVAVSAAAAQSDIDQALALGMNDYIVKPFTPSRLEEVLAKFL